MDPGRLDAERIRTMLHTRRIGARVTVVDEIDSTNRFVLDQPRSTEIDGWVVLAERQIAGRGRRGRSWHCPTGAGLLCTVGLEDDAAALNPHLLALVVPIALCDGIRAATAVQGEIKWPNDIVVGMRKLAGVLIEAHNCPGFGVRYAIGFGVNCLQHRKHFPADLRDRATSLDIESAAPVERHAVLAAVLHALDGSLVGAPGWQADEIRQAWRTRAVGLGCRVCLEHEGRRFFGNLLDIDPTAALVVQLEEGGRRLFDAANTTLLTIEA